MAVSTMVETGVSFTNESGRWLKHSIALDLEIVGARLDSPALELYEELPLTKQILAVRAIEELMLGVFRRSGGDPDYQQVEEEQWRKVLVKLIGSEGTERLGV